MSDELAGLLAEVTDELSRVPGVEAVVLGGSRARGTHNRFGTPAAPSGR